ncbi:hypothetical protein L596_016424 [Steinernema carpocapsae]|uniref:Uncharacterized protein n=1 Tax=Steinernema carpocapsae TaxID=34508 RepID=A0A4U5NIZ9_STECR|nr:hypothetical protein L596_016424 [Steinernema carpocapsae]
MHVNLFLPILVLYVLLSVKELKGAAVNSTGVMLTQEPNDTQSDAQWFPQIVSVVSEAIDPTPEGSQKQAAIIPLTSLGPHLKQSWNKFKHKVHDKIDSLKIKLENFFAGNDS